LIIKKVKITSNLKEWGTLTAVVLLRMKKALNLIMQNRSDAAKLLKQILIKTMKMKMIKMISGLSFLTKIYQKTKQ